MKLDTEITTIQEMTRQSAARFQEMQWDQMANDENRWPGPRETFTETRTEAKALLERARWAFSIAVGMMDRIADSMDWLWITPLYWTWESFWSVEYLMGYAREKAPTTSGHRTAPDIATYTASVSVDVWSDDYEPDWVPELIFSFLDHDEFIELTDDLAGDEARLRELCAAAIVEAYRKYALSDEFVPPMAPVSSRGQAAPPINLRGEG